MAAATGDLLGKGLKELARVELRLRVDSDRPGDRKRKIGLSRQLCRNPRAAHGSKLASKIAQPLRLLCVHIVCRAFPVAVDPVLRHKLVKPLDRPLI
jgi:hypothetical protein